MKKKIFILTIVFILALSTVCFAGTPKVVSKIQSALKSISSWIVKIAAPAAAVALGSGLLMKKFSFGDEERILAGKKLIRSALFSYAFILVIDLVLDAIKGILD